MTEDSSMYLFEILQQPNFEANTTINQIIANQELLPEQACTDLSNLIVNGAGLQDRLTVQDLSKSNDELMNMINNKFVPIHQNDYPLISKRKEYKHFYANYITFWSNLIQKFGDKLYDEVFTTFILTWFEHLSRSQYRSVRHTTCFTAFVFGTALMNLFNEQTKTATDYEQKITEEKKRKKKTIAKIKEFEEQVVNLKSRVNSIEEMLDKIFNLAQNRHKDLMNEVRREVVNQINSCVNTIPSKQQIEETRVILKLLSQDRCSEVRKKVVNVFVKALEDAKEQKEDAQNALFDWAEDMIEPLVKATHDFDLKVAIGAIKVATALVQYGKLNEDQKEQVSKLVMNENAEIRKASLQFVDYGILEDSLIKNTDHKRHQTLLISFVEFTEKMFEMQKENTFEIQSMVKQLIENQWGSATIFTDFSLFCELLLRMQDLQQVNKNHIYIICQILIQSIRIAKREAETPLTRTNDLTKKKKDPAAAKHVFDQATNIVFSQLPDLIKTFSQMEELVIEFIKIPQQFNAEIITSEGNEKRLTSMFLELNTLFRESTNKILIEEISRTQLKQLNFSHNYRDEIRNMMEELTRTCFGKALEALNGAEIDQPETQKSLEVKLARVIELSKAFEIQELIESKEMDERAMQLISLSQYSMRFDPEISNKISAKNIEYLQTYIYFSITWKYQTAVKHVEDQMKKYKEFRAKYLNQIIKSMEFLQSLRTENAQDIELTLFQKDNTKSIEELHQNLFKILGELLIISSSNASINLVTQMKVDDIVLHIFERYLNTLDQNEVLDPEVKKKDQLPSDRLTIVSIVMARIIIGCPDITFSRASHIFMSKFQLSRHPKICDIINNTYSYIKNSSQSDPKNSKPTDEENLYLQFIYKTISAAQDCQMSEQITLNDFNESAKKISNHVSKFKDSELPQFKNFILKIINHSYTTRKRGDEQYSDDIYNIKFLKVIPLFVGKCKTSPPIQEELFNYFKQNLMNLERDKIENQDKNDYTVLKDTQNQLAKLANLKYRIDINALEIGNQDMSDEPPKKNSPVQQAEELRRSARNKSLPNKQQTGEQVYQIEDEIDDVQQEKNQEKNKNGDKDQEDIDQDAMDDYNQIEVENDQNQKEKV